MVFNLILISKERFIKRLIGNVLNFIQDTGYAARSVKTTLQMIPDKTCFQTFVFSNNLGVVMNTDKKYFFVLNFIILIITITIM
jgi:hypothetical protein